MRSRRLRAVCLRVSLSLGLALGSTLAVAPSASAAPVGITLDARVLAPGRATFDIVQGSTGTGTVLIPSRSTATVQEVDLDPATYSLRAPAGGGSGAVILPFTITTACGLTVAIPQGDTTPPSAPRNLRVQ